MPEKQMPRLLAYLKEHHVSLRQLGRAMGRSLGHVTDVIYEGRPNDHFYQDAKTLFEAEGWKVPKDLFTRLDGTNLLQPRVLRRLSDGKIVGNHTNHPCARAAALTRYLSPLQLDPRKESKMFRLTPSAMQRFGLRFDPFFNEMREVDDVLQHKEHKECLRMIERTVRHRDMLFIVGDVGCGKTTVNLFYMEQKPENVRIVRPLAVSKRDFNDNNLLDAIIYDLSGDLQRKGTIPHRRESKARVVFELFIALRKQGIIPLVYIPEAHRLPKSAFQDIKVLHEMNEGFQNLIAFILEGQREVLRRLHDARIREFTQRCAMFEFRGLGEKGGITYLDHKITRAGGDVTRIFDPRAIKEIMAVCMDKQDGITLGPYPLQLNTFVTQALNLADRQGEDRLVLEIVDQVRPIDAAPAR